MKHAEFIERGTYSKEELFSLSQGNLVDDAPPEFIRLPAPPMLMVDRVVEMQRNGARGKIVGEQDIHLTDWFFQCHFRGDPVQPGCLGVDAVWQLVGLYCAACGAPGSGRALGCKEVEFAGQIRPYNKVVRYEVEIRRFSLLKESGSAVAVGSAKVLVDGELIYTVKDAKVGMFQGIAYPDYPKKSEKRRRRDHGSEPGLRMLTAEEVLQLLPQQKPFRFIDRLVELTDTRAVGEYTFRADESFYAGHFPGNPVTPGVILIETMCQTGLVALGIYLLGLELPKEEVAKTVTLFTDSEVEFERVVKPGDTVRVTAEKVFWRRRKLKSNVVLTLADGSPVAKGTVAGMGVSRDNF